MQKRIDEIQSKYREWCHLLPQLEEDLKRWKHAVALIRDMDNFYTHEYQACHQAIEDGAELDLRTEGEYSIMSEDALWNALGEFHQLAWLYLLINLLLVYICSRHRRWSANITKPARVRDRHYR